MNGDFDIDLDDQEALYMQEHHEVIPETEWLLGVKKSFNRPKLFVYWHRLKKKYVLAEWIQERTPTYRGLCLELWAGENRPQDSLSKEWMHRRFRHKEEHLKEQFAGARERVVEKRLTQQEEMLERKEMARTLRKKGLDAAADDILQGRTPWTTERQGGDQLKDMRKIMSEGNKIVSGSDGTS